jgi:hypothetical protein
VLLLWEARLGPPYLAWPFRLAGLAALAVAALRPPATPSTAKASRRQRRVWRLEIGPEGLRGRAGVRGRVRLAWDQLEAVREHPDDVFEVVGRDASFYFDTALSGWPDALGLLHRFLNPTDPDRPAAAWTLTPAQIEEWMGPFAQQTPVYLRSRVAPAEWAQFGLPMGMMGLPAALAVLGNPGLWFVVGVTALAILTCGGILTWLRRGQGVEVAPEGLTLRQAAGNTRVDWAEVVGVAGRAAAGTLRVHTPLRVHLLGCVARAPALLRLLRQVVRLNARNPERLTVLDVPAGALSRSTRMAPEPSDAAISLVSPRET